MAAGGDLQRAMARHESDERLRGGSAVTRCEAGLVAVAHARDDRALGAVRRAEHTGGHTGDHTCAFEDVPRVHPRYRRGTRAPIPVTIS